jgi:hypothetical protein
MCLSSFIREHQYLATLMLLVSSQAAMYNIDCNNMVIAKALHAVSNGNQSSPTIVHANNESAVVLQA